MFLILAKPREDALEKDGVGGVVEHLDVQLTQQVPKPRTGVRAPWMKVGFHQDGLTGGEPFRAKPLEGSDRGRVLAGSRLRS